MKQTEQDRAVVHSSNHNPFRVCHRRLLILMTALLVWWAHESPAYGAPHCGCTYVHPPSDTVITVDNLADLQYAINNAVGRTTILVSPGLYDLQTSIYAGWGIGIQLANHDITIRSETGNRSDVIFDGGGMTGGIPKAFIVSDYTTNRDSLRNITLADITIRNAANHLLSVQGEYHPQNLIIHNVHFINSGEQLVKVNPESLSEPLPVSNGTIACCMLEYETHLDEGSYTEGIDIHAGDHWVIRNDTLRNIRAHPDAGAICGAGIQVWTNSVGTIVERNVLIDCDRGIAFGNWGHDGYPFLDQTDGLIQNNIVRGYEYDNPEGLNGSYEALSLVNTTGTLVANNTLYSPGDVPRGIDIVGTYVTGCEIVNNIMDKQITHRGGASDTSNSFAGNMEYAGAANYIDVVTGNFHLAGESAAIDSGVMYTGLSLDIDCDSVTDGSPDVGADEYRSTTGIRETGGEPPRVEILGCHPNPFNPMTTIVFDLPTPEVIHLEVYDTRGRCVRTLLSSESLRAGVQNIHWDGRGDHGENLASGIYFYRATGGNYQATGKMTLVR